MKKIDNILQARNWQYYLTRPFNLFGASLWHAWYESEKWKRILGARFPDVLFLEEKKDVARCYRPKEQIEEYNKCAKKVYTNTKKIQALLEKAEQLNKQAERILNKKEEMTFEEAVEFLITLSLHATALPYKAGEFLNEIKDKEVIKKTEELRAISYYPRIIEEIIIPLARQEAKKAGVSEKAVDYLTYKEIKAKEWKKYEERKKAEGNYFFAVVDGKEHIYFVKKINEIIENIEPIIKSSEVKGMCAYPGKVKGKVRIVNDRSVVGVKFEKGEILVSVSTSPIYLSLMQKAGAIITDEGGLMCHAAILSRELKIPTIIGTKNATRVLKDGDFIEVDAEKGIVRKVE
ncbi:MAG: PEP-utilizing enzyme [Nanoarchaeota archaeon]|mgnify:CR=1 FL=1